MRPSKINILLGVACVPIIIHFFFLTVTLVNFPSGGDDLLFFGFLEQVNRSDIIDLFISLLKPHNQIHILSFAKMISFVEFILLGGLQFKYFILISNLLLLAISFLFFRYIKSSAYSNWHLISINLLLFAPYANFDNYHLVGVLQHTSSIFFLISIALLLETNRHPRILITFLCIYPFVSTEGWAMLPLACLIMYLNNHPLRHTTLLINILGLIIFNILIENTNQGNIHLYSIQYIPKALFVFVGNTALPISDTYKGLINSSFGVLLLLVSIICIFWNKKRQKRWIAPTIIWVQVLITGILICIGRGEGSSINILVLSQRFYSYGIIALVSTYLLIIPMLNHFNKTKFALLLIFFYFGGSLYYFVPEQILLNNKLTADLTNAFSLNSSTSFQIKSSLTKQLINSKIYSVNENELIHLIPLRQTKIRFINTATIQHDRDIISLQIKQIPNKKHFYNRRWLIIQSIAHPDSSFLVPFFSDMTDKAKVVHINSLQLTDLKQKNLWLYSQTEDDSIQAQYLGSLN